jgi:hypothetical protein
LTSDTCKNGHVNPARKSNGTCKPCEAGRARARRAKAAGRKAKGPTAKAPVEVRDVNTLLAEHEERTASMRTKAEAKGLLAEVIAHRTERRLWGALSGMPLPPIERLEFASGLREATAVALGSDWHVEELVRPSKATWGNAYTLAIARLRVLRFFAAILWQVGFSRQAFKIRNLLLWIGGDMISGAIHEENLETAQLPPTEAIAWLVPLLVGGIQRLLDEGDFERLDIVCSYGNHGRTSKQMNFTTGAGHNLEWLMYQFLAHHFRDEPRIKFLADTTEHQFHKLYQWDWHGHHGHRVKFGGGVGGVMIPLNKATARWDRVESCHFHNIGHFHSWHDVGGRTINGSLIGYNGYAMGIGAEPEVPQQAFYLIDSKRGKSMRSPLWVSDPGEERKLWEAYAAKEDQP